MIPIGEFMKIQRIENFEQAQMNEMPSSSIKCRKNKGAANEIVPEKPEGVLKSNAEKKKKILLR